MSWAVAPSSSGDVSPSQGSITFQEGEYLKNLTLFSVPDQVRSVTQKSARFLEFFSYKCRFHRRSPKQQKTLPSRWSELQAVQDSGTSAMLIYRLLKTTTPFSSPVRILGRMLPFGEGMN